MLLDVGFWSRGDGISGSGSGGWLLLLSLLALGDSGGRGFALGTL